MFQQKLRSRISLSLFSLATHVGGFHLYKDMRHSAQLACSGQPEGALGLEVETLHCKAGGVTTEPRSLGSLVCDGGKRAHSS